MLSLRVMLSLIPQKLTFFPNSPYECLRVMLSLIPQKQELDVKYYNQVFESNVIFDTSKTC